MQLARTFLFAGWIAAFGLCSQFASSGAAQDEASPSSVRAVRVYSHQLEPREHPDYGRRPVKPPSWETFKNQTAFTCLRGFGVQDDRIIGFVEELDKFTTKHELGRVIWPSYPILFATNLDQLADEIKRRDLFLFDIWGYVPGSGPGGYWQQFKPPADAFALLEAKLGERWLGTDIGEQDGRYVGGYANQMTPASASRFEQYLNFDRHFDRMSQDLGGKHATLVSLNFGHYLLKQGTFTLIGAETAQGLPNNQVYYAFIRGAGKQYGVPWFGNASIYNRWGYKTYSGAGRSDGYDFGPTRGTSLSLMKRLLYSHILYNCVAVGFENGWFEGEQLSPIGLIQQSAQRWVKEHGQPGVMHTPVALLLDFYAGWSFPRHLYSGDIYRAWGNRPYEQGDYFTDAVLDLLYPSYQDSSYFHDESGFIAPTPYGDIADCLLSDAPLWLLDRYAAVVVAGELGGGREIRDKLQAFTERGGHLILTSGNLAKLPGGIAGQTNITKDATVPCGKGVVTFLASPFGVKGPLPSLTLRSEIDHPLPKPYVLEPAVRRRLEEIFRAQALVRVDGTGLSYVVCRKHPGLFTVGLANNTWTEQPFHIEPACGVLNSIRELPLDESEKTATGYTPETTGVSGLGHSSVTTIAGGDFRIFEVSLEETNVFEIPHAQPPPRPRHHILTLRRATSIKNEILARPAFFEHFNGVCVDWEYLHARDRAVLQSEAGWLRRQQVRVLVDLSSGLNLFPTLRLIDNLHSDYETSMGVIADVLAKMELISASDLIVSLHRSPENNFSDEQTRTAFTATLKSLAAQAGKQGATVHLRLSDHKPPWNLAEAGEWLERVNAPNLKLAPSTALWSRNPPSKESIAKGVERIGLWLTAGAREDVTGKIWDVHVPLSQAQTSDSLREISSQSTNAPIVLDALFSNQDEEYLDAAALEQAERNAQQLMR